MSDTPDARAALLDGFFDDAGLFSPAALPMSEAVARHRKDRTGPHARLLSAFVVPALRLPELAREIDPSDRWALSVILVGGESASDIRAPEGSVIRQAEIRSGGSTDAALNTARALVPGADVYVEILAGDIDAIEQLATAAAAGESGGGVGVKIRCGGTSEKTFPAVESLAQTILSCRNASLPFKATAGLHQPVRYTDAADGFVHHGFLNLLAACSAALDGADEPLVSEIIGETDPTVFALSADGFSCRDQVWDAERCAAARVLFRGIGTCSFDEPVGALQAMAAVPL